MTARYQRHPELRLTELEGEGVVLHLGTKRYFSVSETGLTILQALEQPRTVAELVSVLLKEYEVSEEDATESVRDFLEQCEQAAVLITH